MRLCLPQRPIWRAAVYLVSLLLVLVAIDLLLIESRRKIRPGYFTTRIAAPRQEDGSIDYLAALEAHFGAGITPENNAAPLLLRAFGRTTLPSNQPENGVTDRLGVLHLPQQGDYFVRYEDWCRAHSVAQEPDPTDASGPITWPIQVSSVTSQWIEANAGPLALIAQASKRPRFFIPFYGGYRTTTLLETLLPHVPLMKEIHRPLLTRALLRLEHGDVAGFHEDVLTVHRLARLIGQAPTVVERIVAISMLEIPACRAVRMAALSGKLSSEQARALADDLASLGDLPPLADSMNVSERFMALDAMQALARMGPKRAAELFQAVTGPSRHELTAVLFRLTPVPYENSMRAINYFHDGMLAATRQSTYAQRMAALQLCEAELEQVAGRGAIRNLLSADWPAMKLLPSLTRAHERTDVARIENRLSRVTLALAAFQADHAAYPAALAELVPGYLPSVPSDLFSEVPLIYARRNDGYTLFSVGPDAVDNGGQSDDITANVP